MKIVAGIVLYNPDIERLKENISAVLPQVDEIILFDNGSENIQIVKKLISSIKGNFDLLVSNENLGIAYALNKIARRAINKKYKWLLTLDQDSVIYPGLVKHYKENIDLQQLGQLSCRRIDRNIEEKDIILNNCSVKEVKYCITSGTLISLQALKKINGFDQNLFIDWVDNEVCCALRKVGYKTYEMDYKGLLQEMGHATSVNFLGKKIYTPNYPPIRYFYIARNSIYVARKYPLEENRFKKFLQQIKLQIHILFFEKNKMKKIKAIKSGIYQGLTLNLTDNRGLYEE